MSKATLGKLGPGFIPPPLVDTSLESKKIGSTTQVAPKSETPAKLEAPELQHAGLPSSQVQLTASQQELLKGLDTASKAARTSAANLTSLASHLLAPRDRVKFDPSIVDHGKLGFAAHTPNRDAIFAKAGPALLKDIGPAAERQLSDLLGVKTIGQLAKTSAAELDVLLQLAPGEPGLTEAQLAKLKAVHAKLVAYEDTSPTIDMATVSKVRARLEATQKTVDTMAGLVGSQPVQLNDALVRLNATFQWLEQASASLDKLSDEELAKRVKGSPSLARKELHAIRATVDSIVQHKEAFHDAKTLSDAQRTHKKELGDATTALLTQPLDAASPFKVKQLPNLSPKERIIETEFLTAFEQKGPRMVREFLKNVKAGMYGPPNVIAPDDAKLLSPRYARADVFADKPVTALDQLDPESKKKVQQSRAEANIPLHMTATVIARLALVQALDDLAKDTSIPADKKTLLVTCGGVAAGKGFAVKHAGESMGDVVKSAALVYDTDGETSGTFNAFVMQACKERGIKPTFLYVHADPEVAWERVFSRAAKEGRMVSEEPFLDSHVDSPRNFAEFYRAHRDAKNDKGEPLANFVIIDNASGTPKLVDEVPPSALGKNRDELRHVIKQKTNAITEAPDFVIKTAKRGEKLWPERTAGAS